MDANISAKEFEKLSKYKDIQIETERMWKLKTSVPIVVGALGLVKKEIAKHLEKMPGKQNLAEIHKNSTYWYCTHIKKSVINISYIKKRLAQNKNPAERPSS